MFARFDITDTMRALHRPLIIAVGLLSIIGVGTLYSVADSSFAPWSWRHGMRLGLGFALMIAIALTDIRRIYAAAYFIFAALLVLLIGVEFFGERSMGAQRWLDLGIVRLQPSEFMRVGLILALARYYQTRHHSEISHPLNLLIPIGLIITPTVLVFLQPDLGTAIMLAATAFGVLVLAGVHWRYFALGALATFIAIPFAWGNLLAYQKQRILVFLNPERDPLGAGYHIIQSKIGIGSGGLFGKGFGEGTQSRLNFLPEKHTDFIFTIFAEEMGFLGGVVLILLFAFVLYLHFRIAAQVRSTFARLCVSGISWSLFVYVAVNLAMVMGLLPVVGVPLPFVSYGGTSLLTFLISIGVVLAAERHAMTELPKS